MIYVTFFHCVGSPTFVVRSLLRSLLGFPGVHCAHLRLLRSARLSCGLLQSPAVSCGLLWSPAVFRPTPLAYKILTSKYMYDTNIN